MGLPRLCLRPAGARPCAEFRQLVWTSVSAFGREIYVQFVIIRSSFGSLIYHRSAGGRRPAFGGGQRPPLFSYQKRLNTAFSMFKHCLKTLFFSHRVGGTVSGLFLDSFWMFFWWFCLGRAAGWQTWFWDGFVVFMALLQSSGSNYYNIILDIILI